MKKFAHYISLAILASLLFISEVVGQNNLLNPESWTVGFGSINGFGAYGPDAENERILGTNPYGDSSVLWMSVPDGGSTNSPDGGYYSPYVTIDPSKTYRLSVWMKKTGDDIGNSYLGLYVQNSSSSHTTWNMDNSLNTNPYFWYGDLPQNNKWYLIVGYVHPNSYSGPSLGGIYDPITGQKVATHPVNDFKFGSGSVRLMNRGILYGNGNNNTNRQYYWNPTIYEVNGSEPSEAQMLANSSNGLQGITMMRYNDITGTSLAELFNNAKYPDNPDFTSILNSFEIPSNTGSNYGVKVSGFITPMETGTYYFWIASDDSGSLELSPNMDPNSKVLLSSVPTWASDLEWNKFPEQQSVGVNLVAGQHYYVEANMKEGAGGDHLAVGWRKPSDGPGSVPAEIIPATVLSPLGTNFSVNVTGISLNSTTLSLEIGQSQNLIASISPSNATNQNVNWTSSNTGVATVSTSGVVSALTEGAATITATTVDGGFTATSTVTVTTSGGGNPPTGGDGLWTANGDAIYYLDNVAIGRNSVPTGYKLAVDGHVRAREVKVDTDNWPDYVFKPDYSLLSLEEIEKHILENGHLPNVLSAKEMEVNGMELSEMNKLLLEKIEELTLYILEHEEQLKKLELLKYKGERP